MRFFVHEVSYIHLFNVMSITELLSLFNLHNVRGKYPVGILLNL